MNKLAKLTKFTLDFQEEFLRSLDDQPIQQIIKKILDTPFSQVVKGYQLKDRLQNPYLFEILAVRNLSEPHKTRFTYTKDCLLQFILYPNIVAITIDKHTEFDLFAVEGKKILVPQNTEIHRSVILLRTYTIINQPDQLL